MKKLVSLVLVLALMLAVASGCAPASGSASASESVSQSEAETAETVTVTDNNGNSVTVKKNAQRIVVCDILPLPSVLTVFFNSGERIVGMNETSMSAARSGLLGELYPEVLKAETGFIKGAEVNIEELLKLDPDVVFYSASNPALGEKLTASGFAAVAISADKWDYNCIETLKNWISLLGEIFPDNDKSAVVNEYSDRIYKMIGERVSGLGESERKRVFFLFRYSESEITTSGKSFFGQWWADSIGAVNVAESVETDKAAAVGLEQVYAWDPEMIFLTNYTAAQPDDIYNNSIGSYDWSGVSAVSNKQCYKMPLGLYRAYTPGADTPMTLLWFAKTTYPALFEDIDLASEIKSYYSEVFGVTLTDAQVGAIYNPDSSAAGGF